MVTFAYSYAARHDSAAKFQFFWLGVLIFVLPAATRLAMKATPRLERLVIVTALAAFAYLPKLLRDPSAPAFHDEFAHLRQAEIIQRTGHAFLSNPLVSAARGFPGLELTTIAVRNLTGVSMFHAGEIVIAVAHILALLGIFIIAERLLRSPRAAGLAALCFFVSPGFMYFTTQYSYESLAITFVIWVLALLALAADPTLSMRQRWTWLAVVGLVGEACVVTHHVSSYVAVLALLAFAALATVQRARVKTAQSPVPFWVVAGTLAVSAVLWALWTFAGVGSYLTEPLISAWHQVGHLLSFHPQSRTLFSGGTAPSYESMAAYATVGIAVVAGAFGLATLWRYRPRRVLMVVLAALGLLYFPSLLVDFTQAGGEAAHRSWAFTYIGLAVLIAPALLALLHRWDALRGWRRRASSVALGLALVAVLVGNVAADQNVYYRFPGKYVYGSDARSTTPELISAANVFAAEFSHSGSVTADRYSALAFASYGQAWTGNDEFPVWQLYYKLGASDNRYLLATLQSKGYRYLVIDKRMPFNVPVAGGGAYFDSAPNAGVPPPAALLTAYDHVPWATKVFDSSSLEIYSLNYATRNIGSSHQ